MPETIYSRPSTNSTRPNTTKVGIAKTRSGWCNKQSTRSIKVSRLVGHTLAAEVAATIRRVRIPRPRRRRPHGRVVARFYDFAWWGMPVSMISATRRGTSAKNNNAAARLGIRTCRRPFCTALTTSSATLSGGTLIASRNR